jgi:hypothetical protein
MTRAALSGAASGAFAFGVSACGISSIVLPFRVRAAIFHGYVQIYLNAPPSVIKFCTTYITATF